MFAWRPWEFKPTQCLAHPVDISDGRTFCQLSLDPYFRAVRNVLEPSPKPRPDCGACLPVRTFDPKCLFSASGKAILPLLLEHCCMVIVYDADLRPFHVKSAGMNSNHFVALDMTRALRLRGNHCYVLGKKDDEVLQALEGERLW